MFFLFLIALASANVPLEWPFMDEKTALPDAEERYDFNRGLNEWQSETLHMTGNWTSEFFRIRIECPLCLGGFSISFQGSEWASVPGTKMFFDTIPDEAKPLSFSLRNQKHVSLTCALETSASTSGCKWRSPSGEQLLVMAEAPDCPQGCSYQWVSLHVPPGVIVVGHHSKEPFKVEVEKNQNLTVQLTVVLK
jgi:hypothetical protein